MKVKKILFVAVLGTVLGVFLEPPLKRLVDKIREKPPISPPPEKAGEP